MSTAEVVTGPAPPAGDARGVFRWVCTQNPFYVLSAGLFLSGLWISFGGQSEPEETWALMGGLVGYTLLLAGTATLLVRFGNVWDDVRTVMLLVVLMFLATSVTFDQALVFTPERGVACFLVGFAFCVAVSEALLWGTRLRLPALYRGPYYSILALFFFYPLALSPFLDDPRGEPMQWGLFSFATVAGLVFLTLLPAIRRGPEYVNDNGSPWRWPLYPWTLFGLLALAVPGRAFLLCWSMHLLDRVDLQRLIIGPYFFVPFGFCLAVLLLEIGIVSASRQAVAVALAAPAFLVGLSLLGHRSDPVYRDFLNLYMTRLGGSPAYLATVAAVVFYVYAVLRRVSWATEALTAALLLAAFIGPKTVRPGDPLSLEPWSILAAGVLQLALGLWHGRSWRSLLGTAGVVTAAAIFFPPSGELAQLRGPLLWHVALLAMLLVGAVFDDDFAWALRSFGPFLVFATCLAVMAGAWKSPGTAGWPAVLYPLAAAVILAGYGFLLGHPVPLGLAVLAVGLWLVTGAWRLYAMLRQLVSGLDYLAVSFVLFAVALAISVSKAAGKRRGLATPKAEPAEPAG